MASVGSHVLSAAPASRTHRHCGVAGPWRLSPGARLGRQASRRPTETTYSPPPQGGLCADAQPEPTRVSENARDHRRCPYPPPRAGLLGLCWLVSFSFFLSVNLLVVIPEPLRPPAVGQEHREGRREINVAPSRVHPGWLWRAVLGNGSASEGPLEAAGRCRRRTGLGSSPASALPAAQSSEMYPMSRGLGVLTCA